MTGTPTPTVSNGTAVSCSPSSDVAKASAGKLTRRNGFLIPLSVRATGSGSATATVECSWALAMFVTLEIADNALGTRYWCTMMLISDRVTATNHQHLRHLVPSSNLKYSLASSMVRPVVNILTSTAILSWLSFLIFNGRSFRMISRTSSS
jgi:hypothetical protein